MLADSNTCAQVGVLTTGDEVHEATIDEIDVIVVAPTIAVLVDVTDTVLVPAVTVEVTVLVLPGIKTVAVPVATVVVPLATVRVVVATTVLFTPGWVYVTVTVWTG